MAASPSDAPPLIQTHIRVGWWSLALFLSLGFLLEVLHGFKIGFYLDVGNEQRRLMWTLAHAHGALLGLVHLAFGLSLQVAPTLGGARQSLASRCMRIATVLLPGGFFLGGVWVDGRMAAVGFLLVPVGGAVLATAIFLVARSVAQAREPSS